MILDQIITREMWGKQICWNFKQNCSKHSDRVAATLGPNLRLSRCFLWNVSKWNCSPNFLDCAEIESLSNEAILKKQIRSKKGWRVNLFRKNVAEKFPFLSSVFLSFCCLFLSAIFSYPPLLLKTPLNGTKLTKTLKGKAEMIWVLWPHFWSLGSIFHLFSG